MFESSHINSASVDIVWFSLQKNQADNGGQHVYVRQHYRNRLTLSL
ncbi:hypothetical protein ALP68_102355 [Pseudomonas ficuserectae]|uniref:Uncharacterized protein n=17 Tax=Pseudomonas syringae group TaxID=136849 RepID=A0AAX1W022_PSEAJ|nr:Uncharacterized protein AC497_3950 [Pseudomonas savastanoi pv. glycinea]KPC39153.1 Uncharacterized protein AC509_2801 [Pseudomonas amygdali pv. morsprunorum]KPW09855.1 hypothetical protein ALO90_102560 [Pseudomonas amygdali pv. aesculi]KPW47174.1 hypothetical protein ALO82_102405 [Pseudomonas syringae pv. broussonetiae]KPW76200.1 hypothetical protein ALO78_102167 [Pseudomonas amygdali pv. ciccaronei]KPW92654.1 hypothetical protein ALO79_100645 [Pseudomonas syringae pv. castaneae]KPX05249.1